MEGRTTRVRKDKEEADDFEYPMSRRGEREAEIGRLARSGFFSSLGEAEEGNPGSDDEVAQDAGRVVLVTDGGELDEGILDHNLPEELRAPEGEVRAERFRRFIFTCNNYCVDVDGMPTLWGDCRAEPRISYFICGCEYAPTTGTPHLQGYFECKNPTSIKSLQTWPCFQGAGVFTVLPSGYPNRVVAGNTYRLSFYLRNIRFLELPIAHPIHVDW